MIESFRRSLNSALRSRLAGSNWLLLAPTGSNWLQLAPTGSNWLPLVHLGLRSAPKDDTSLSVSEAVYGAPFIVPGEF